MSTSAPSTAVHALWQICHDASTPRKPARTRLFGVFSLCSELSGCGAASRALTSYVFDESAFLATLSVRSRAELHRKLASAPERRALLERALAARWKTPKRLRGTAAVLLVALKSLRRLSLHHLAAVHAPAETEEFRKIVGRKQRLGEYLSSSRGQSQTEIEQELAGLQRLTTGHHSVFLFVRSALRATFPGRARLWGSTANERSFLGRLRLLLAGNRFDSVQTRHLVSGVAVATVPWAHGDPELVAAFARWLVAEFVFPLVRAFFYVTETGGGGKRLAFYRKEVWQALVNRAVLLRLRSGQWKLATDDLVWPEAEFVARFVPKVGGGTRAVMARKVKESKRCLQRVSSSVNKIPLSDQKIGKVLALLSKQNDVNGCGISNMKDMHQRWLLFQRRLRSYSRSHPVAVTDRLFYMKADIERCFDNIPTSNLLEVVQRAIRSHSEMELASVPGCGATARLGDLSTEIYSRLSTFLARATVRVGGCGFRLQRGIPQGWHLSSALCSIYYGTMETEHFYAAISGALMVPQLLVRYVDDYLFVSVCERAVESLLESMTRGFEGFSFRINPKKTVTNVAGAATGEVAEGDHVSWLGLLLPVRNATAGVYMDVSGRADLNGVRASVTMRLRGERGSASVQMLRKFVSRKIATLPICWDARLNSGVAVVRSLYRVAVLAARLWKVHERQQLMWGVGNGDRNSSGCAFAEDIRHLAVEVAHTKVKAKLRHQLGFPGRHVITWLFYKAFFESCRGSRHRDSLRGLLLGRMTVLERYAFLTAGSRGKSLTRLLKAASCVYSLKC